MSEPKIFIYSVNGMNRAGKSTQLSMLKNYLENQRNIPTVILRGFGRRTGIEDEIYEDVDYDMTFWDKFKMALNLSTQETYKKTIWQRAGDQLEKEILYFKNQVFPQILKQKESKLGIILLDRSWIHRFDVERQRSPNYSTKKIYKKAKVQPEHNIILKVSLPELLRRAKKDKSKKSEFRMQMLRENYPTFEKTVPIVKEEMKEHVSVLDGNRDIDEIQQDIRKIVDENIREKMININ